MPEYKTTTTRRRRRRKKRMSGGLKVLIGLLIVIALILAGGLAAFHILFNVGKDDPNIPTAFVEPEDEFVTENEGDKSAHEIISEMRSNNTLSDILRDWATNNDDTKLMYDDNVLNVILMGIDASGGNSDVIMLVSVDEKDHKIFLTSFMRDSYTYMQTPNGGAFAKVNAAYANGGADCLIDTIQNDYKIRVDYYATVNFRTFSAIVDKIGGVDVPVKQYEAEAMGNLYEWGDSVRLNGEQALMYCRIRYSDEDGDVSRTRRQRTFISSLINRCRDLPLSQLTEVVTTLLDYIRTDCSTAKILSLGTKALMNKWYDYEIVSMTMPAADFRKDYYGNAWVWIVDYPAAAQYLQTLIYDETNIKLNRDRVTAIDAIRRRNTGEAHP